MKKKKISRKLILGKSTVVNLSVEERRMQKGGVSGDVTCPDMTCGGNTCMGTNCDTYDGCEISIAQSCLHMCLTEKLYPTCHPIDY